MLDLLLGNSTDALTQAGVGVDETRTIGDTQLQGSVVVLDDAEATTGWSNAGDGTAISLDTTIFQEGSGSLQAGATAGSDDAEFSKTITSVDISNSVDKIYFWVFLEDHTQLTNSSSAVKLTLGTSGFTNSNEYQFSRDSLNDGWTALIADVPSPDVTNGSGATLSDVDSVKIAFETTNAITSGDIKWDYIRVLTLGNLGIADSLRAYTKEESTRAVILTGKVESDESNGYDISSSGVSTSSLLFSKNIFSAINKGESLEIQTDFFITIE